MFKREDWYKALPTDEQLEQRRAERLQHEEAQRQTRQTQTTVRVAKKKCCGR